MNTNRVLTKTPAERVSGGLKPLPRSFRANFMIVGAQKAGTTALASFLSKHPDVFTMPEKEAHFFSNDAFFSEGKANYTGYHLLFKQYAGEKAVGEATPNYMFNPKAGERLRDYNPGLKLILLLRHPVDRAYSQYMMNVDRKKETLSFSEAIHEERTRLFAALGDFEMGISPYVLYSYVNRGYYMAQIKNLLRYFPREQMLFLRNEDLLEKHEETLLQVYDFLGVAPIYLPPRERIFAHEYEPMSAQDRRYLLDHFAHEIDSLEEFLGWDLSAWRK